MNATLREILRDKTPAFSQITSHRLFISDKEKM